MPSEKTNVPGLRDRAQKSNDESKREQNGKCKEQEGSAAEHDGALDALTVREVARGTGIHLGAMGGLDAADAIKPPRAVAKDILANLTRPENGPVCRVLTP